MLKWVHGIQGGRTNRDTLPCYTVFTSVFLWYVPEVNHWKYFLRLSGEMYGLAITVDTTIPWYRSCRPTPIRPYLDKEFQAQSLPWSHLTFTLLFLFTIFPYCSKWPLHSSLTGCPALHPEKTIFRKQWLPVKRLSGAGEPMFRAFLAFLVCCWWSGRLSSCYWSLWLSRTMMAQSQECLMTSILMAPSHFSCDIVHLWPRRA